METTAKNDVMYLEVEGADQGACEAAEEAGAKVGGVWKTIKSVAWKVWLASALFVAVVEAVVGFQEEGFVTAVVALFVTFGALAVFPKIMIWGAKMAWRVGGIASKPGFFSGGSGSRSSYGSSYAGASRAFVSRAASAAPAAPAAYGSGVSSVSNSASAYGSSDQGAYDAEEAERLEQQRRAEAWNEGGWRYVGWGWDEDHLNRVVYVYLYWYHPTTNQWAQLGFGALGTKNYDWSIEDEYKRLKECLRYVGRADYLDAFPECGHNGMVTQFRGGEGHPGDFHPYQEGTPDELWMRYAFFDEGY